MKIDITDTPNRAEAQRQLSLKYPDLWFVPVWENKSLFMVDEEEINTNLEHYQKLARTIWFAHNNGMVHLRIGKLVIQGE